MAGTATPIFPQTLKNFTAQILNATGSTAQTLVTGGTNGTKVEALTIASTDTSARDVQLTVTISSVTYILTTVSIPITAGSVNSTPSVDLLHNAQFPGLAFDANGNKYLYVANGAVLKVATLTTVTSGKEVDVFGYGEDF